jgi:aminoglycoside 3-N-acetyltransferase
VQALLDVLGPTGTLVVPAQTANNRDPSTWTDPVIEGDQWDLFRANFPGFDPAVTPSYRMGVIAEQVRTWPGAVRSAHPQTSFAAVGPRAAALMADHRLESPLGEHSPLARLEEADAKILLLGVGMEVSTIFHLAEYRLKDPPRRTNGCAVLTNGSNREWVTYPGIRLSDADFADLGKSFEAEAPVAVARVGDAECRLFTARRAIDYAVNWLSVHRGQDTVDR